MPEISDKTKKTASKNAPDPVAGRDCEWEFRTLAENMTDFVVVMELDFKPRYVSPSFLKHKGYTQKEFADTPLQEQMTPASLEKLNKSVKWLLDLAKAANAGEKPQSVTEIESFRKDRSSFVSEARLSLICNDNGEPEGILLVSRDISDRKQMEAALLESEERYKRITRSITDYIYTVRFENSVPVSTTHGAGCREVTGYTNEDFQKDNLLWIQMVHPEDRQKVRDYFNAIRKKPASFPIEHRIVRKDGHERWVLNTPVFHFGDSGELLSYDGVVQDITTRKLALEAVNAERDRYRSMFSGMQDMVWVNEMLQDGSCGKFVEANETLCSMLGYSRPVLLEKTLDEIFDRESYEERKRVTKRQASGKNAIFIAAFECADKRKIPAEVTSQVVNIAGKSFVLSTARAVSERIRIREEMFRAQHMESLSMLAGGIAHDFNNLLGGIFGYIDIAREYSDTPDKSVKYLEKALRSLDRAKDLSNRLLTFSKGGVPVKKTGSVVEIIKDSAALSLAGKNVKAVTDISSKLCQCEVDASQIGRVFSNLIINAQQAMPNGGILNISAKNTEISSESMLPLSAGTYVMVSFRDHGAGIPAELRKEIFEPFFTTKKKGSGLGLAICRSIITKHDGHIDIFDCPGDGAEFRVYLPAKRVAADISAVSPSVNIMGSGKILVMDDEEYVLDFASTMLRQLGYTPVTASYGEEAEKIYLDARELGAPFAAVILDLTVPGGEGGEKTIARLLTVNPDVIAIASSGYSNDPVMAEPARYGFKAVLPKPYVISTLGKILKEAIGEHE